MKIINLVGSPHGAKGNTARLSQIVSEGAESLGASIENIFLTGKNVLPCLGCDACHKKGKCVQHDEFENIKQKIHNADGLILASPNYIFSVSAQMKAFMDRAGYVSNANGGFLIHKAGAAITAVRRVAPIAVWAANTGSQAASLTL